MAKGNRSGSGPSPAETSLGKRCQDQVVGPLRADQGNASKTSTEGGPQVSVSLINFKLAPEAVAALRQFFALLDRWDRER